MKVKRLIRELKFVGKIAYYNVGNVLRCRFVSFNDLI